jgi:phage-related protein
MGDAGKQIRHRWRDYSTARGRRPVKDFIDSLPDGDAAEVVAAMREIAESGLTAARHLRGDVYEVRADGSESSYRVLFAPEGTKGRVLLALEAFKKKTQKTPVHLLKLAESRLTDWRARRR